MTDDLNKTLEKLKESEEKFRTITEQSIMAIAIQQDNKIVYVNQKCADLMGYSVEELIGWSISRSMKNMHPDDIQTIAEAIKKTQTNAPGALDRLQYRIITKAGNMRLTDNYSTPITYHGRPADLVITLDITERKRIEDLIHVQRDIGLKSSTGMGLKEISRSIVDIVINVAELDYCGIYIVNQASGSLKSLFSEGLSHDTLQTLKFIDADSPRALIVQKGTPIYTKLDKLEIPINNKLQQEGLRSVALIPIKYKNKVIGCFNVGSRILNEMPNYIREALETIANQIGNVISTLEATKKLKESEEKYRILFDHSPIGIGMSDLDGNIFASNQKMDAIFGYEENEFNNLNSSDTYVDLDDRKKLVKELLNTGRVQASEIRMKKKDGSIFHARMNIDSLKTVNKKIFLATCEDITERKITEEKLKESEEKFREAYNLANFYKDLFGHDMNNILQTIVSTADYYKTFRGKPEMLAKLGDISDVIIQHTQRGANLISNVRKLSSLEDSEVILKPTKLLPLINKSINDTISGFQKKKVKMQVNGMADDLKVIGNELLVDVFDNLLNNAVKYDDNEQEVIVEIDVSKTMENSVSYVKIEVKDRGMGVPDKRKKDLFKKSREKDISRRGMGIGLSLVKTIIDKYGGMITVQDRNEGVHEKGSNFIIFLREAID